MVPGDGSPGGGVAPPARPLIPSEPLTLRRLVRTALATYRLDFLRVAVPAVVVFVPLAIGEAFIEYALDVLLEDRDETIRLAALIAALASTGALIFGQTFYAGLLDRLVGARHYGHEDMPVGTVLRTLPYKRLILANLVVGTMWAIGLVLFLIPGLIVVTLLSIVGPLVNVEGHTVRDALIHSVRLVRPRFMLAFLAITLPLGLEHLINDLLNETVWDGGLLAGIVANSCFAVVVGATVGLIEVTLAHELIARDRRAR